MSLILPGDPLPIPSSSKATLQVGPGLQELISRDGTDRPLLATHMGVLRSSQTKKKKGVEGMSIRVDSRSKRYIPALGDHVLGTVVAKHAEGFRVELGSSQSASLDKAAFEGMTKRMAPKLEIGSLVYARVCSATRDMEPEIECVNQTTQKADGFGELKEGFMIECSLRTCRLLYGNKSPLRSLEGYFPFSLESAAIGFNGRIWVHCTDIKGTIAFKRLIEDFDKGKLPGFEREEVESWLKENRIKRE